VRFRAFVVPVIIGFGGSILMPSEPDPAFLRQAAEAIHAWSKNIPLGVVVGGGSPARRAINTARQAQVGEEELDRIGIAATRLNAQLLASTLYEYGADVARTIPTTVQEAIQSMQSHQIVVMGGTTPGHSTDFVAAEWAAAVQCPVVIATSVDGVYTIDPLVDPNAQRKATLNFGELLQIVEEKEWTTAGAPGVIDGPATVLLATHGVETRVVHGRQLAEVGKAVRGEEFHGTLIGGDKVVL